MAQRVNLSPTGLPVQIKVFVGKTASSPLRGQISELGVMGLPVRIRSFIAKTSSADTGTGTGILLRRRRRFN